MVIPFSYIVMWVSIFGNGAIDRIRSGDAAFEATLAAPEQGYLAARSTRAPRSSSAWRPSWGCSST